MPESGHEQPDEEISLPFNLYFGALNHPHWSTYDHNDRDARRRAEEERSKVREERVAKLPRLMDHLHYVKIAAGALPSFDRNGQGPDAAENLRTATRRFQAEVQQLAAAIDADAVLWRENGRKAMEILDQAPVKLLPAPSDGATLEQAAANFGTRPADRPTWTPGVTPANVAAAVRAARTRR
jgi:hypothetical protein